MLTVFLRAAILYALMVLVLRAMGSVKSLPRASRPYT